MHRMGRDGILKVTVEILEGRSPEQKASIVEAILEAILNAFSISRDSVTVRIVEASFYNMASSGKLRSDTAEGESKYGALLEPRLTVLYTNEHSVDQRRKAVKQMTEKISEITGVSANDILIFFQHTSDGTFAAK